MLQKQYGEEEIRQESKIDFLIDTVRHLYSKEYSIEQVCEILRIDEAERLKFIVRIGLKTNLTEGDSMMVHGKRL